MHSCNLRRLWTSNTPKSTIVAGKPVLDICYEQLSSDIPGPILGACQYLGFDMDASPIQPALQKVGASDLRDVVSNYKELIAHESTRELLLRD